MSGAIAALVGGQCGVPQGQTISTSNATFSTNGTGPGTPATPPNWFSCINAAIGTQYWIKITRTGGTPGVNFSQAQGTWVRIADLTSGGSIGASGGAGSCSGTYQLAADSAGSKIVASGTISVSNIA